MRVFSVYTVSGARCHFPFKNQGEMYTDCIEMEDYKWCSLTPDTDRDGEWGKCDVNKGKYFELSPFALLLNGLLLELSAKLN